MNTNPTGRGEPQMLAIGPDRSSDWWSQHNPPGGCLECGGQCDGDECGLHAAGCVFGGPGGGYWLVAPGCPLFHGEVSP